MWRSRSTTWLSVDHDVDKNHRGPLQGRRQGGSGDGEAKICGVIDIRAFDERRDGLWEIHSIITDSGDKTLKGCLR